MAATCWYHVFSLQLILPRGLTCSQCVLQWKWNTASNWGCDGSNCGKGCGPQEQFYGCSDVSISSDSSYLSSSVSGFPLVHSGSSGISASVSGIGAPLSGSNHIGLFPSVMKNSVSSALSAISSSAHGIGAPKPPNSPHCQATQFARSAYAYADQWCQTQCKLGNCPQSYCEAGCRSL